MLKHDRMASKDCPFARRLAVTGATPISQRDRHPPDVRGDVLHKPQASAVQGAASTTAGPDSRSGVHALLPSAAGAASALPDALQVENIPSAALVTFCGMRTLVFDTRAETPRSL